MSGDVHQIKHRFQKTTFQCRWGTGYSLQVGAKRTTVLYEVPDFIILQISLVGHGGSLVDSAPFVRRVVGSNLALDSHHVKILGKSFTHSVLWRFSVKL